MAGPELEWFQAQARTPKFPGYLINLTLQAGFQNGCGWLLKEIG